MAYVRMAAADGRSQVAVIGGVPVISVSSTVLASPDSKAARPEEFQALSAGPLH